MHWQHVTILSRRAPMVTEQPTVLNHKYKLTWIEDQWLPHEVERAKSQIREAVSVFVSAFNVDLSHYFKMLVHQRAICEKSEKTPLTAASAMSYGPPGRGVAEQASGLRRCTSLTKQLSKRYFRS